MSGTRARSVRASKPRSKKASAASTEEAPSLPRSSSYRGPSRAVAAAAYHADALVMARMGYAPSSEQWSSEVQQVLLVQYIHAPDKTQAVLEALAQAKLEPVLEPQPPPAPRDPTWRRLLSAVPSEAAVVIGTFAGLSIGIALCFLFGWFAGETPDAVTIGGFGILGLALGFIGGATRLT